MNKKIVLAFVASMGMLMASAQDIYKVESLVGSDLNGTARFVGMGGAMSALGADLSTMNSNPAGIGMYRRNDIAATLSLTTQPNGQSFMDIDKSRVSFDQVGLVYTTKIGSKLQFANFGFNYQKRRNFKNYIGIDNAATGGLSQARTMQNTAFMSNGFVDLATDDGASMVPPFTYLGYTTQMLGAAHDANGKLYYEGYNADAYNYKRVQWGGIQEYDFNLAFNVQNQIYFGFTVGVHNVNFHSALKYEEYALVGGQAAHNYYSRNEEQLKGTGYDFKAGVILRPILENPFRIGFSISTPTWYDLTYDAYLEQDSPFAQFDDNGNQISPNTYNDATVDDHDYKVTTPWKFNLSLGTTIGKQLALDAEYEYADYSASRVSYPDYDDYYYWSDSYGSTKDMGLRSEIKSQLKGVSTLRFGAEYNFIPGCFLRAGYNYVSSPFKSGAYLNQLVEDSPAYYYQANTDYVNLSAINRYTLGFGYRSGKFYVDAAYQYQHQTGDVFAFQTQANDAQMAAEFPMLGSGGSLAAQKVNLNRHNFMLTLGFKF